MNAFIEVHQNFVHNVVFCVFLYATAKMHFFWTFLSAVEIGE